MLMIKSSLEPVNLRTRTRAIMQNATRAFCYIFQFLAHAVMRRLALVIIAIAAANCRKTRGRSGD